jgi:hypothetical protein
MADTTISQAASDASAEALRRQHVRGLNAILGAGHVIRCDTPPQLLAAVCQELRARASHVRTMAVDTYRLKRDRAGFRAAAWALDRAADELARTKLLRSDGTPWEENPNG